MRNIERFYNLKKLIKKEQPDIILSFLPRTSYMTSILKGRHAKLVISVRNNPSTEYASPLNNFLMRKLYSRADGFVFQTRDAQNYFPDNIRNKGVIILNPISSTFLEPLSEVKGRKHCIVSVGRLTRQKNQQLLINAFSKIYKDFLDYKLVIYGYGELENQLKKQIKDLNLDQRVELRGIVDNIKNEIYDASMFVLTSNYEGLPNALIEAMVMGLPCISTDCPCGGPRMLINNNVNGVLISVNDENELIKAMKKILQDENFSNKISKNAKKIANKFNPDIIYKSWEMYLQSVCLKGR